MVARHVLGPNEIALRHDDVLLPRFLSCNGPPGRLRAILQIARSGSGKLPTAVMDTNPSPL
jgi:hypothetical protein